MTADQSAQRQAAGPTDGPRRAPRPAGATGPAEPPRRCPRPLPGRRGEHPTTHLHGASEPGMCAPGCVDERQIRPTPKQANRATPAPRYRPVQGPAAGYIGGRPSTETYLPGHSPSRARTTGHTPHTRAHVAGGAQRRTETGTGGVHTPIGARVGDWVQTRTHGTWGEKRTHATSPTHATTQAYAT